jgi:glycosyltransferase involved in cell wall biosynthesis
MPAHGARPMLISFIIPAWNEETLIGQTIDALHAAASGIGCAYEILVVDDASTDRTARIATERGARVVPVRKRQIAAVRNAGAREAKGDVLIFVDADTLVPEPTLFDAIRALEQGAVGGGAQVRMAEEIPLMARLYLWAFLLIWTPLQYAAGCYIFVRRQDFEQIGGFDEAFFAGEEVWLSKALKARGRFVILRKPVWTSGRKMRMHTPAQLWAIAIRLLWKGPTAWKKREGLELWYDGRREGEETAEVASSARQP